MKTCRISSITRAVLWVALMTSGHGHVHVLAAVSSSNSIAQMQLEPGLKVELVTAEPLVVDPVALCFDELGGMYVAENRGYPGVVVETSGDLTNIEKPNSGQVAYLQDLDGDGYFETRSNFATGLSYPNGVLAWNGGVLVTCAPNLLFLKDTDGDGLADIQEVWFTGFDSSNTTQLRVSHPTYGPDGWIYLSGGLTGGTVSSPLRPDIAPLPALRKSFRFHPDLKLGLWDALDANAQFGWTFHENGDAFFCVNRVHARQWVYPLFQGTSGRRGPSPWIPFSPIQDLPAEMRKAQLPGHGSAARIYPISSNRTTADSHSGSFTAACGLHYFRGNGLPGPFQNQLYACDPTGALVHRDLLCPQGVTYQAVRDPESSTEFLASEDDWFRPVYLTTGPDGALYVCDMYRKVVEHPQYLPKALRSRTDFESGRRHGRIYRVVKADQTEFQSGLPENPDDIEGWLQCLQHENGWIRDQARQSLWERRIQLTAEHFNQLALLAFPDRDHPNQDDEKSVSALAGFRTLIQTVDDPLPWIHKGVKSSNALVRSEALSRLINQESSALISEWSSDIVGELKEQPARVQFQALLAISMCLEGGSNETHTDEFVGVLVHIAQAHGEDPWMRKVILGCAVHVPERFLTQLLDQFHKKDQYLDFWAEDAGMLFGKAVAARLDRGSNDTLQGFVTIPEQLEQIEARSSGGQAWLRDFWVSALALSPDLMSSAKWSKFQNEIYPDLLNVFLPSVNFNSVTPTEESILLPNAKLWAARYFYGSQGGNKGTPKQIPHWIITGCRPTATPEVQAVAGRTLSLILSPELWLGHFGADLKYLEIGPSAGEALWREWLKPGKGLADTHLNSLLEKSPGIVKSAPFLVRQKLEKQFEESKINWPWKVVIDSQVNVSIEQTPYREALDIIGDTQRGRQLFADRCSACHRLDQLGVAYGPDLFSVRNQPKSAILRQIIEPNAEISPGFEALTLISTDGSVSMGLLQGESPHAVSLEIAPGVIQSFQRSDIRSLTPASQSIMPPGLLSGMTAEAIADLLAFIQPGV